MDFPDSGPNDREPCPDGACIGVIGPNGRCSECGQKVGAGPGGPMRQRSVADRREPCPDGACIGVIDQDGRCSECGRGPQSARAGRAVLAGGGPDDWTGADDDWSGEGPDLENRRPCSDGACIGIIGPQGRCTECGKRPA